MANKIGQLELNKIYNMDCLEGMKLLSDNSVDLVVTSPPYDNLREYKGYSFDFENIADEIYRIIKTGGVIVWVVGDATINGSETGTSFKQALYFKEIGFNLHDTMIYVKNGTPYPDFVRYYQIFEYMFILSKGKPKTIHLLSDKINKSGNTLRKNNKYRDKKGNLIKKDKTIIIKEKGVRNNVWVYNVGFKHTTKDIFAFKHPAMFPEKLAKDHILSWSNEKDIVLDPFAGAGTTLKMAKQLNRNFIGFEISKEYCDIANRRLEQENLQNIFERLENGN